MALENSDHKETSSIKETLEKLRAQRASMRLIIEQRAKKPIVQTNERVKEQVSAILPTIVDSKEATSNFEVDRQRMETFMKELLDVNTTLYLELLKSCHRLFYTLGGGRHVFKTHQLLKGTEMASWSEIVRNILKKEIGNEERVLIEKYLER